MENFLQAIDTLTIRFALAAVLLPLFAFVINICLPGKGNKAAGWISTLAILASAYREDDMGGEVRTYLALAPKVAPVKAMVSPLLKNKPELVAKAQEVRKELQKVHHAIAWDDNGNIGKRYRRQDEIGTPFCITIDFDTLGETPELKDTVTIRDRDTGKQERVTIAEAADRIRKAIQ